MANTLYRAPFYFDSVALREELKRHRPVNEKKDDDGTVTILCKCGADTGPCSSSDLAVEIWAAHFAAKMNPV